MPVLQVDVFEETLDAVSRLNQFVRAPSSHWDARSLHEVIYWFKRLAVKEAIRMGTASHRLVEAWVSCRSCHGTGIWQSFYNNCTGSCRTCGKRGIVGLRFVETTIGTIKWHTPQVKCDFFRCLGTDADETDWKPNQPGLLLEADELARLLNLCEERLTIGDSYPKRYVSFDLSSWYVDDFATYSLYVGKTEGTACDICEWQLETGKGGYGCSQGRIRWTGHACAQCAALYTNGEIFKKFPLPLKLLDKPNIREWIMRHKPPASCG